MDKVFLTILNMSLTGAFVIAAICLARLPLKKAPKIISYCLWAVAEFRLVFPFSIESVFSLLPFKAQPIPPDIATQAVPRIDSGISFVNNALSGILPAATPTASVNPLQIWTAIGAYMWLIGAAVMLIYGVVSFVILKNKIQKSAHVEANIYEAKNILSPFVLGIFAPKIYLPIGLSEQERGYIILHEQTHIRRCDHIVKFGAYFILCLHWFNPLAWVAFLLMGVDMEMSCDERVLKELGGETKHDYSRSLLSLATERRVVGGSPLAFSEGGIKQRIKNVLNFRKPSRVIVTLAVVLVAVLSVGFAVNRASATPPSEMINDFLFEFGNVSLDELYDYEAAVARDTLQVFTESSANRYGKYFTDAGRQQLIDSILYFETMASQKQCLYDVIAASNKPSIDNGYEFSIRYYETSVGPGERTLYELSGKLTMKQNGDNYKINAINFAEPTVFNAYSMLEPPESTPSYTPSEEPSPTDNPYKTRELSRDGVYKLMEMYVYDETVPPSKRITFELPVEWDFNSGSVFANGESGQYSLKVDMGSVISAARDDVLTEFNNRDEIADIFSENIYSTKNFEVFQYKHTGIAGIGDGGIITTYYLYANGERFSMCAYVFTEDKPEYDEIFKRIAQSVKFQ